MTRQLLAIVVLALAMALGTAWIGWWAVPVFGAVWGVTRYGAYPAATARLRMYTRADELPEGVTRLPVKTIHLNKLYHVGIQGSLGEPREVAQASGLLLEHRDELRPDAPALDLWIRDILQHLQKTST